MTRTFSRDSPGFWPGVLSTTGAVPGNVRFTERPKQPENTPIKILIDISCWVPEQPCSDFYTSRRLFNNYVQQKKIKMFSPSFLIDYNK